MKKMNKFYFAFAACLAANAAWAADAISGEVQQRPLNVPAVVMFFIFVGATLFITKWAAKKNKSSKDFYTAGGGISGFQNGLAIAGDFMSAASFLGISAMVFTRGYDGLIYSTGFLVGWPLVLFLVAERLRNLGKFTFSDVVIVGVLMVAYVLFGGMLATTWVQMIKAVLLLSGASFMAFVILKASGFSMEQMFAKAVSIHEKGSKILEPGGLVKDPIDALSLGLALMFGTAGLPHILMRFFTVPDAKEARKSVFVATGFIGYFYILTFIIGFGAIIFVTKDNPNFFAEMVKDGKTVYEMIGGSNMAAVHLSEALGGNMFLGFISAVAFATILAVVAGLTLSGASAVSHDIYASVIRKGKATSHEEMRVSRATVLILGVLSIIFGLIFENQNVAFMVGLAFAVAASANFPILALSMFWKGLTTRGAVVGGYTGLLLSLVMIILGPSVWVSVFHFESPVFPYGSPAIFSIPAAFIAAWLASITDKSARAEEDKAGYEEQYVRSMTGIGAEKASDH